MSTVAVQIPTGTWQVDPVHSSIGFRVRHMGVSWFRGSFKDVTGSIETSDDSIASITGTIAIPSLAIDSPQLAGHLLSPDFFDAETHPEGTFASTKVERVDEENFRVTGDLTLRGVTSEVVLDVTLDGLGPDISGTTRIGLSGCGEIDRTTYGIVWNAPLDNGAFAVGEKVRLALEVEAQLVSE